MMAQYPTLLSKGLNANFIKEVEKIADEEVGMMVFGSIIYENNKIGEYDCTKVQKFLELDGFHRS
jgi:hypothetical protein